MKHDKYPSEQESRELIVDIGNRLYSRGFVASNDGNISVRLSTNIVLATPTGVSKGYMTPDLMSRINLLDETWEGTHKPSSEIKMHRAIYLAREDVQAVVHAHPPISTAFSVAGIPLDKSILAEVIISLGEIPIAEYQTPSTQTFADQVASYIKKYDAVLLANHGAVTVGKDLLQAHYRMETLEHYAHISWIVRQLGSANVLNFDQVKELMEMRSAYNPEAPTERCATCPNNPLSSVCSAEKDNSTNSTVDKPAPAVSDSDMDETVERIVQEVLRELF